MPTYYALKITIISSRFLNIPFPFIMRNTETDRKIFPLSQFGHITNGIHSR